MKVIKLLLPMVLVATSILHARFTIESVSAVRATSEQFVQDNPKLHGKEMADGLRKHLVSLGYTFAQVSFVTKKGFDILEVKEGKIGTSSVSGNQYLSDAGIAKYLNWQKGQSFNYGVFQRNAANLNRRNFIQVDAKLAPTRTEDGEILVNADFTAQDSLPVAGYVNARGNFGINGGTTPDNSYRTTAGLEYWEPFFENDRISGSVTTDPSETSDLIRLGLQYNLGYGNLSHSINASHSKSSKTYGGDDSVFSGYGYYLFYAGSYDLDDILSEYIDLSFGFTYIDHLHSNRESGRKAIKTRETLYLPRVGFNGRFSNPGLFGEGKNFWSISATHDFHTSQKHQIKVNGAQKGFYYIDVHLTSYQPVDFDVIEGGFLARLAGKYSPDVLPRTQKSYIGGNYSGSSAVRGYGEGEDSGDRSLVYNIDYRLKEKEILPTLKCQPFVFYDIGHIERLQSSASNKLKRNIQSVGAGVLGNFSTGIDFSAVVGVPLKDGPAPNSLISNHRIEKGDPRIHLDLTWKF